MNPDEERKLVQRCRRGDRDAFRCLFHAHRRPTFRVACRLCGSHHDAEEVLQEAWTRAWRGMERFAGASRFGTWVMRIVINCATDLHRRRAARPSRRRLHTEAQPESSAAGPMEQLEAGELKQQALHELGSLPAEQRSALVLVAFEGLSYSEAAETLGCPEGTLAWRVARAREKLTEKLAPYLDSGR